jgi:zinc protease
MRRALNPPALVRRASVLALTVSLLCAGAAHATPGVDEPPVPGTPRALLLPAFEETTLANGVRVIVAPRHDLPLATVALHLRLGAAADPDGRAGLASITAQLRTKGAQRDAAHGGKVLTATDLARATEALGASLEAGAGWNGSSAGMTVATSKLAAATSLLADVVLRPTLAEDEFERLRAQVGDGLKLPMSDPMALAGMASRRSLWSTSVYGGSMTPASLARITRADVQAFAKTQARPDLATLVFAGDVTLEQARGLAQQTLGAWPAATTPLPQARRETPMPQTPTTVLVNLPGAGQSGVVVAAPSVAIDSPERRVAQVASAVLGGGYSARLNTEVRIKRGLSYGANAGSEMQPVGGVLSAVTQTNHPTAAQVATLMQGEITGMAQRPPGADELAARQATLVGGFGRQIETTQGLAGTVLDQVARGKPLRDLSLFAPEVLAVTPEQVRQFAATHWQAKNLRTVVVGDLAAAGDSLKALDPAALVLDAGKLDLESPVLQAR